MKMYAWINAIKLFLSIVFREWYPLGHRLTIWESWMISKIVWLDKR